MFALPFLFRMHSLFHPLAHTCVIAHTLSHTLAETYTHAHTFTHTHTHFHTHTHTRTDSRTDTLTHRRPLVSLLSHMRHGTHTLSHTHTRTPPRAAAHPYGLDQCWVWLARLLNQPPRRWTALALEAALQMAGYELQLRFRQQMPRLLHFIGGEYAAKLDGASGLTKGPKFRVMSLARMPRLPEPEGRRMPERLDIGLVEQSLHAD